MLRNLSIFLDKFSDLKIIQDDKENKKGDIYIEKQMLVFPSLIFCYKRNLVDRKKSEVKISNKFVEFFNKTIIKTRSPTIIPLYNFE